MNWQEIKVSDDTTHFLFNENKIFGRHFIEVLKFHAPGIAPVKDNSGSFHIDIYGNDLYQDRYYRTFGFYCNRAAIIKNDKWFHIDEKGKKVYKTTYLWTGNYQENVCTVRDLQNNYFHIDLKGNRCYKENYRYAGDFKDEIACVRLENGNYKHIDKQGKFITNKEFLDLGVYHKNFATAKDKNGWFHIDKLSVELYQERYLMIEPFYNGFALVTKLNNVKQILDEQGKVIVEM